MITTSTKPARKLRVTKPDCRSCAHPANAHTLAVAGLPTACAVVGCECLEHRA